MNSNSVTLKRGEKRQADLFQPVKQLSCRVNYPSKFQIKQTHMATMTTSTRPMLAQGAPSAKVARGGSAHGDGSDGVGAVVEEVLKTKTDEQQQCHSKEGGKRRADPCQQVKRLSWRLNHPSKVNCVNDDATIVSPQVSLGRNHQGSVCKQKLWGEDARDKPQTSYDLVLSSMLPGR